MLKFLTSVCLLVVICSVSEAKQSRAKQNFFCNDILNKQIKFEFDASNVYLSLVSLDIKLLSNIILGKCFQTFNFLGKPLF